MVNETRWLKSGIWSEHLEKYESVESSWNLHLQ